MRPDGIDDRDGRSLAERLLDRRRQRKARRRPAGDDQIEYGQGFGHGRGLLERRSIFGFLDLARNVGGCAHCAERRCYVAAARFLPCEAGERAKHGGGGFQQ